MFASALRRKSCRKIFNGSGRACRAKTSYFTRVHLNNVTCLQPPTDAWPDSKRPWGAKRCRRSAGRRQESFSASAPTGNCNINYDAADRNLGSFFALEKLLIFINCYASCTSKTFVLGSFGNFHRSAGVLACGVRRRPPGRASPTSVFSRASPLPARRGSRLRSIVVYPIDPMLPLFPVRKGDPDPPTILTENQKNRV